MDITVIENNETTVIKFTNKIRTRKRKEKKIYKKICMHPNHNSEVE